MFIVCWHAWDHYEVRTFKDASPARQCYHSINSGWTRVLYDATKKAVLNSWSYTADWQTDVHNWAIGVVSKYAVCWHEGGRHHMRGFDGRSSAEQFFRGIHPGLSRTMYDASSATPVLTHPSPPNSWVHGCTQQCARQSQYHTLQHEVQEREAERRRVEQQVAQQKRFEQQQEALRREHEAQRAHAEAERKRLEQEIRAKEEALQQERAERKRREQAQRRKAAEDILRILKGSIEDTNISLREANENLDAENAKLADIEAELTCEKNARSRFRPRGGPVERPCRKIVLIGDTGDGKSTLANRLVGDESTRGNEGPFATSGGIRSHTETIQTEFVEYEGQTFCVVDTPGGGDSMGRDRIHATSLVDFLHGIGEVHAFVWVRNFAKRRLADGERRFLQSMNDVLGVRFWSNVVLVFTRVDVDDPEELEEVSVEFLRELFAVRDLGDTRTVGIGRSNFPQRRCDIFDAVLRVNDGQAFAADRLVAPVEELQERFDRQSHVCKKARERIEQLTTKRESLQQQQEKAQQSLLF